MFPMPRCPDAPMPRCPGRAKYCNRLQRLTRFTVCLPYRYRKLA